MIESSFVSVQYSVIVLCVSIIFIALFFNLHFVYLDQFFFSPNVKGKRNMEVCKHLIPLVIFRQI